MTDRSLHVESAASETSARAMDDAFAALADGRRRIALSHLLAGRGRTPVAELAERVAATEADAGDVDEGRRRDVELSLHHVHLPKLEAAGLVDLEDDAASPTDRAGRLECVLERLADASSPDAALSALADRRRRSALRHADSVEGSLPLSALAARVAAETDDDQDAVALDLHHRDLPKLDDAGLLSYDGFERRVDDAATPAVDADALVDALDRALGDASASSSEDLRSHVPL